MAKAKLKRSAIPGAVKAALDDIRVNGRAGRTIPEIAGTYRLNPITLRKEVCLAGLSSPSVVSGNIPEIGEAIEPIEAIPEPDSKAEASHNSLINKADTSIPSNHDSMMGGKRGDVARTESRTSDAIFDGETEAFFQEVRKNLLREVRIGGLSMADLQKAVTTWRGTKEALKGTESVGKAMIQVSILSDASSIRPREVRVIDAESAQIMDSSNENVADTLATVAVQGIESPDIRTMDSNPFPLAHEIDQAPDQSCDASMSDRVQHGE